MKKRKIIIGLILTIFVASGIAGQSKSVHSEVVKAIASQLKSGAVYATVPSGAIVYDAIDGNAVDMLVSGTRVEILRDKSTKWYYVGYKNHQGWIKDEALKIPADEATNPVPLTKEYIEGCARNFKSATKHFVWVDIDRQRIYILKNENKWTLEKTIVCATGMNISPTTRGYFKITDRGKWFYSDRLGSGAINWVRFNDSYLFHSVAMDKNKNVIDGILGKRRSSGCVRMSIEDSKWFYDNMEENTVVWIY